MERTVISWSVPNIITINAMAWVGFLILVVAFQLFAGKRRPATGKAGADSAIADY